jgi:O-antigen/teichoic acid export membrane protein
MTATEQLTETTKLKRTVARAVALRRSPAGRDFAATAGANLIIAVFTAAGGIMAARLLGPEGRGVMAAAVVWAAILNVVVTLGLPQALTYYVAREPAAVGTIFHTALGVLAGQSVLAVVGGWLLVNVTLASSRPMTAGSVQLYLLSIPASALLTYLSTMGQGLRRFRLFNNLRIAASSTYIIGLAVAWLAHWRDAQPVIAVLVIMQWMVAAIGLIIFVKQVRLDGRFEVWRARQLLRYGLKSYWGSLSWMANARLDQFLMSALVSAANLGMYAVAVSYATVLFPLSGAIAMVLFPRVAASEHNQAIYQIKHALRLNLILSGSGAMALGIVVSQLLPWLFGADYEPAIYPALILLGGTVLLGMNYVLSDGLRGLGAPLITSVAEVVGLIVTIGGLWVVLPATGISGAAWVSVISYGVVLTILLAGLARTIRRQQLTA